MLLVNSLAAAVLTPILPLVAVDLFGASILQALLLETTYYATKLIAAPLLGRLSDRHGRRLPLLVSQSGTLVGYVIFLLAGLLVLQPAGPLAGAEMVGLLLLYLGRLCDGATAGNTTIAKAIVVDVVPDEAQSDMLSKMAATFGLSFIVGPALGGLLLAWFGYWGPFSAALVLALLGTVWVAWRLPETGDSSTVVTDTPRSRWQWRYFGEADFRALVVVGILTTLCFAGMFAIFVLYVDQTFFPAAATATSGRFIGFVYTLSGIVLGATQLIGNSWLRRRLTELQIVRLSLCLLPPLFLLIAMTRMAWLFLLLVMPFVALYGVVEPNLQALLAQQSRHARGERFGVYQSALSGAELVAPLWVALVFESIAPSAVWLVGAVVLLVGLGWTWRLVPVRSGPELDTGIEAVATVITGDMDPTTQRVKKRRDLSQTAR